MFWFTQDYFIDFIVPELWKANLLILNGAAEWDGVHRDTPSLYISSEFLMSRNFVELMTNANQSSTRV